MITDVPEFTRFLLAAKRSTYAGDGQRAPSSRPASSDLVYAEGEYRYLDTYLGSRDFAGEEAVWLRGAPVWAMNYYGWMLAETIPDGFGEFLKAALRAVSAEAPFRGPARFREGDFEYACTWQGDVQRFEGREQIRAGGRLIYELGFHGGALR